jgi:hypothetical protein
MYMLLLLLGHIHLTLSCLSSYTILSGFRTLYYNSNSGAYLPAVVLPTNIYFSSWLRDPEAKWVWWTTQWAPGTIVLKDTFGLAQWAVEE